MHITLGILLVALLIVAKQRNRAPGILNPALVVLVVLIFSLQGILVFRGCRATFWAAESEDFFEAAGYKMGQVIRDRIPDGGDILLIHGGGDFESAVRVRESYFDGLREGWDSADYRIVEADPSQVEAGEMMSLEQSLTVDMLPRYLEQHPDAVAMVSMVGVPSIPPGTRLPPGLPPLFLLGSPRSNLVTPLFQSGVLKAAVFFKGNFDRNAKPSRKMSMDQLFEERFELVEAGG